MFMYCVHHVAVLIVVGLLQIYDKCVYVYCVESVSHIECYSDCSHRGSHLIELLYYGVAYCV